MTTRWEVENAVGASEIEPMGRFILLTLLTRTTAGSAEIPPRHAPSYTDMEALTGLSRSALIEWMKALTDSGWVRRIAFEGESKEGFALSIGDPKARRAPRSRANKSATIARIPAPRAGMDVDPPYRPAVHPEPDAVSPGGMDRTAQRYSAVPPGGTGSGGHLIQNSPTESSLTTLTVTPPLFGEDDAVESATAPVQRTKRAKKSEPYREDVEKICAHLAEAVVASGSKRPTISDKWRAEARLLLDEERNPKATVEKVIALIDWIQTSDWWTARIQAMPKLRAKYDEVRLDAVADYNRKKSRESGSFNSSGYQAKKVNGEPGRITDSWNKRRAANAQQQ